MKWGEQNRAPYVYPKFLMIKLLTVDLSQNSWNVTCIFLRTVTKTTIGNTRCILLLSMRRMTLHMDYYHSLSMVVKTINHVLTSVTASMTWYFLRCLFSVPPESSRTRSRAAILSSLVKNLAWTGESGSHITTQIPTKIARPPRRM